MLLNKDNKKLDLIFYNGGLYRRSQDWDSNKENGKHDYLWRTSLGYITYKDNELKNSIRSCFIPVSKGNRFYYQVVCS